MATLRGARLTLGAEAALAFGRCSRLLPPSRGDPDPRSPRPHPAARRGLRLRRSRGRQPTRAACTRFRLAIAGGLAFDSFYIPPTREFGASDWQNWLVVAIYILMGRIDRHPRSPFGATGRKRRPGSRASRERAGRPTAGGDAGGRGRGCARVDGGGGEGSWNAARRRRRLDRVLRGRGGRYGGAVEQAREGPTDVRPRKGGGGAGGSGCATHRARRSDRRLRGRTAQANPCPQAGKGVFGGSSDLRRGRAVGTVACLVAGLASAG